MVQKHLDGCFWTISTGGEAFSPRCTAVQLDFSTQLDDWQQLVSQLGSKHLRSVVDAMPLLLRLLRKTGAKSSACQMTFDPEAADGFGAARRGRDDASRAFRPRRFSEQSLREEGDCECTCAVQRCSTAPSPFIK